MCCKSCFLFHRAWCKKKKGRGINKNSTSSSQKIWHFHTWHIRLEYNTRNTQLARVVTDWPVNIWPYCHHSHGLEDGWNLKGFCFTLGTLERGAEHQVSGGALFGCKCTCKKCFIQLSPRFKIRGSKLLQRANSKAKKQKEANFSIVLQHLWQIPNTILSKDAVDGQIVQIVMRFGKFGTSDFGPYT